MKSMDVLFSPLILKAVLSQELQPWVHLRTFVQPKSDVGVCRRSIHSACQVRILSHFVDTSGFDTSGFASCLPCSFVECLPERSAVAGSLREQRRSYLRAYYHCELVDLNNRTLLLTIAEFSFVPDSSADGAISISFFSKAVCFALVEATSVATTVRIL